VVLGRRKEVEGSIGEPGGFEAEVEAPAKSVSGTKLTRGNCKWGPGDRSKIRDGQSEREISVRTSMAVRKVSGCVLSVHVCDATDLLSVVHLESVNATGLQTRQRPRSRFVSIGWGGKRAINLR